MQGAGNDYIYVNTLRHPIADPVRTSIKWSSCHTGIGSDGLVLIGKSTRHGSSPAYQLQTNKYPGRQNVGKNNHSRWKRIQKNICLYVKSIFSGFHR